MSAGSAPPQANGTIGARLGGLVLYVPLIGFVLGHVRSMIRDHNFAPGNTGYVFWLDNLAPVPLIVLYIATG